MIDTIVNSFDIWTDAQGIKSRIRVNSVENISLEGIARLREIIMELAVLGKLVPQDPNDEPASVLLKTIEKERDGSTTVKKRKKELPPYTGQILNSKITGWELCKLEDIGDTNIGLTYSPNDVSVNGTIVLRSSNIQNGEIELSDLVRVNKKINENVLVKQSDLLICARNGSKKLVGKCALIRSLPEPMAFGAFMAIFRSPFNEYCRLFIESPIYRRNLEGVTTTTINQITQDNLKSTYISLPPFAEQQRIVAKVDELMSLCDKLEEEQFNNLKTHQVLVKTLLETLTQAADSNELQAAWERMSVLFDTLFCTEDSIDQLKQTILQLAITGKLVKHDANDEPSGVLIKKIAKEKDKLVKEGILKKETSLSEIDDDEFPFQIPKNWEWVRLGNITNKIGSGSTPRGGNNTYTNSGILFLRSQNIRNEGLLLADVAFIDEATNRKMSNSIVIPKDILLNITGGSLGRCTIFPEESGIANVSQHVTIIRPTVIDSCFYLHACILSPYIQDMIWGRQIGANREGLSKKILEQFEIPYPPLKEQKRIVTKIHELFKICDLLTKRINNSQVLKVSLSKTIVEKAVQ